MCMCVRVYMCALKVCRCMCVYFSVHFDIYMYVIFYVYTHVCMYNFYHVIVFQSMVGMVGNISARNAVSKHARTRTHK